MYSATATKPRVVIIIPTYNEEAVIAKTIYSVLDETRKIENFDINILVFDSCSSDQTYHIVQNLCKNETRLYCANEEKKTGLGSAYWQAMHLAISEFKADIVIEFDADLSHQPCYIKDMLDKLNNHDVVIGSRYIPGGEIPKDWGWYRKALSILGNRVARCLLTLRIKDFTSGFRATRTTALKKVLTRKFLSNHYAYKIDLLWSLYKSGAKIVEHPIKFIDRETGYSKLPRNSIVDSLRVISLLRYYSIKRYLTMCRVGLLGAAIQLIIYNILRQHYSLFLANLIAVSAAIVNNYVLNNYFTFKQPKYKFMDLASLYRFILFIAYSILIIFLQSGLIKAVSVLFDQSWYIENLIVVAGIIFVSMINYLFYSRFLWPDTAG